MDGNPRSNAAIRTTSCITPVAAAVVAFAGVVVLAEWALGSFRLARVSVQFIPMAPATALCFVLAGAALFCRQRKSGRRLDRLVWSVMAGTVLIASVMVLLQGSLTFTAGRPLDIEQCFAPASTVRGFTTGRMSPLTSILFVLVSLATLISYPGASRSRRLMAQGFAAATLAASLVLVIGYWYGTPLLYGGQLIPVALPTAIGCALLGLGLLFERPDSLLSQLVISDSIFARITRLVVPGSMAIILVGGWFTLTVLSHADASYRVISIALTALLTAALVASLTSLVARHVQTTVSRAERALRESEARYRETNAALERAIEQIGQMASDSEAANLAKSQFLANMSHEIRTPMTAILGFADELLDPGQSEADRGDSIATIRRNGEHLLNIINDILDLSKIEAGRMTVDRVACSPRQIVANVALLMRVRVDVRKLAINVEYATPVPELILTDPTRLQQILVNLVANAVKFTEAGEVRLTVRFVDQIPAMLEFDVTDTGIGMTGEQLNRIFQPFVQGDDSTTRRFGGTGLGLTISKRLAQMLGGDITIVDTAPGSGTTFRIRISTGPLDCVGMIAEPSEALFGEDRPGTVVRGNAERLNCRILLAEDGPDNQRLISHILQKAGADVTVAENGRLAVDAVLAARDDGAPFDIVLMDMQMPVMGGCEAVGRLRLDGYDGPIIALTAHAMGGDHEKCLSAGCDDYASKPIDRPALVAMVKRHLQTGSAAELAASTTPVPPGSPAMRDLTAL